MGETVPSRGFTNILKVYSPFYAGYTGYKILPSMLYGNLGLFQVSSMGRSLSYYSGFLLPSWDISLPITIPKSPPVVTVEIVTQKLSQPYPGLLPKGGNVHIWLQYFPCQGS